MRRRGCYYVYITTNQHRTVLYVGMSGDLSDRAGRHLHDALFTGIHFTGKYQCFYVVYFEAWSDVRIAIAREDQLKGWRRSKKLALIRSVNPTMRFLNDELI